MKKIVKEFEQIGNLIEHNRTVTVGAVFYETYHSADYAAVSERVRLDEFVQSPIAQLP